MKILGIGNAIVDVICKVDDEFIKKNNLLDWNTTIIKLHKSEESKNIKSKSFRRLAFDEICANFLTLSKNRKRIKSKKKK